MSLWVDVNFANQLGPHLRNFKRKNDYLWNFSCPVCGDSSKNTLKARGYIYKVKSGLFVKCHNCDFSTNLGSFIKRIDPNLHREYVLENYKDSSGGLEHTSAVPEMFTQQLLTDDCLAALKRIDQLDPSHPAVKYCLHRKLPAKMFHLLYYAPRFKKYVNTLIPEKFKNLDEDQPRLVIPYFNAHGKCYALTGRAFGAEEPKYCMIKLDEREDRIFGIDRVDYSKHIYVVEGPLDSLFLPNCVAVSGSSFMSPTIEALKTNATIIFDREPRSPELTKIIDRTIDQGYSVCLLPDTMPGKDINDMILAGKTPEQILAIINDNTFQGASAQLRFAVWRKC